MTIYPLKLWNLLTLITLEKTGEKCEVIKKKVLSGNEGADGQSYRGGIYSSTEWNVLTTVWTNQPGVQNQSEGQTPFLIQWF